MRKRIFPRVIWFLLLNCVIFVLLVMMQFTHRGNFSQKMGEMLVSGRYSPESSDSSNQRYADQISEDDLPENKRAVEGGASVVFGGLEFRLSGSSSASASFCLLDSDDKRRLVIPEYIAFAENSVTFTLPGNTELTFTGDTSELHITVKFSDDISAVEIPVRTQRASIVRSNENDTLNILYNGSYYQFSRPMPSLESGQLVLLAASPLISYHAVTDQKEINPVDFIIPQAESAQTFSNAVSQWVSRNYSLWSQMGSQTDEDTVIAWCGEAVRQGNYRSAVSAVPVSFSSSPLRTWESAVYQFDRRIGVWERAARSIGAFEREKNNFINRLITEKNSDLFLENHLIEFFAIRGNTQLIDNFLSFAKEFDPDSITPELCPGILENGLDMIKWRPDAVNPFYEFTENVWQLVINRLRRAEDQSFIFIDDNADITFNLRLGKAVYEWGEKNNDDVWAGLGRSIILSVLSLSDDSGSLPQSLTAGDSGRFTPSAERIAAAEIYRILAVSENLPHWAASGVNGIWAWTAASSLSITQTNQQMDISVRFPVGETHYIMLRNIKPFPLLQIYGMNWRRAVDFESYYNSSGWYYFEQEQTLVLKINQRSSVEMVRIFYVVPRAPEPVEPPPPAPAQTESPPPPPPPPPAPTQPPADRPYQY